MKNDTPGEWIKLDNAATIYPAVSNKNWNALFRLSADLNEPVDPEKLDVALQRTLMRFPAFRMRLRKGVFWYFMERNTQGISVKPDVANPCVRMKLKDNGGYMFRVRYYKTRIAAEIFHVLTDGAGGLSFLKTLVAEYLTVKYGAVIPRAGDILDCSAPVLDEEMEDSFARYARTAALSRAEAPAYCIRGTHTPDFMHIISGVAPVEAVRAKAKEYNASIGEFLTAVLISSIADVQKKEKRARVRMLPVKVNVPVNLRGFYPSRTLRNFASYVNPGIEPKLGDYSFSETVDAVRHYMGLELTEKRMNARFTTNVIATNNMFLRIAPLPLKNAVLKVVYVFVGDRYTSSSISNLGRTSLPPEMARYVRRFDFMLGPLYRNPVTCACLSYDGSMVINFTRTIVETEVERGFFTRLVKFGIPVTIDSNDTFDEDIKGETSCPIA